jgi:hypothetical protein
MALSANSPLTFIRGELSEAPVKGTTTIYEGAMLGDSSGYARGLVAGDAFIGHAMEYIDNSGGSDGGLSVKRMRGRYRLEVTLTGVAITDVGNQVYASADDTLTQTAGSNSRVGVIDRYVTTNTCIVEFQTTEIAALVSDLTAMLSDLALNSYSDFNVYVSDTVVNKSDIVVVKSDMVAEKSDAVVFKSDITALLSSVVVNDSDTDTNTSDIVVIKSDITANDSDITVLKSDMVAEKSDAVVFKSDIVSEKSDTVIFKANRTKVLKMISDAKTVFAAGDWANVSDTLVTMTEVLAAMSDALI